MFYVGQKVSRFRFGEPDPLRLCFEQCAYIAIGETVTIREIVRVKRRSGEIGEGLRFQEYTNPTFFYDNVGEFELDYKSENFRPIVERKTDISIFKAMLNPSKQEVGA